MPLHTQRDSAPPSASSRSLSKKVWRAHTPLFMKEYHISSMNDNICCMDFYYRKNYLHKFQENMANILKISSIRVECSARNCLLCSPLRRFAVLTPLCFLPDRPLMPSKSSLNRSCPYDEC